MNKNIPFSVAEMENICGGTLHNIKTKAHNVSLIGYSQQCLGLDVFASAVSSREAVCSQEVSATSFHNSIHIKLRCEPLGSVGFGCKFLTLEEEDLSCVLKKKKKLNQSEVFLSEKINALHAYFYNLVASQYELQE